MPGAMDHRHVEDVALPDGPPFALRGRVISATDAGDLIDLIDAVLSCDDRGVIDWIGPAVDHPGTRPVIDVRPLVSIPGLIDLHAHLPQSPITGLGLGTSLMDWLEDIMVPAERAFAGADCHDLARACLGAFGSAGTTTVTLYGSVDAEATNAAFEVAADTGQRVILGQCLMDRMRYDQAPEADITDRRLGESQELCERWHGYDNNRLMYAFTPRFALSCTAEMLRESAQLARSAGAYWQTHLAEDEEEGALTLAMHNRAKDYLEVYEQAGALDCRTVFAHGVHLSDDELLRLREADGVVAHCPANLFGTGGLLDLGRYRDLGIVLGLGSDVGGSTEASLFKAIELGWVSQISRRKLTGADRIVDDMQDWFRLATINGARALGLEKRIGTLEPDKDLDLALIDVDAARIVPGSDEDDTRQILFTMAFRNRPDMVRSAYVRGRRLV